MKTLLIVTFFLISFVGLTQEFGYFGKRNTLSVSGFGSIPIIYWYRGREYDNYKTQGKSLIQENDYFDGGLNLSLSHCFSGKFALGLEYNLIFANSSAPSTGDYSTTVGSYETNYYFSMKHEQLSLRTNVIMPKIEYTLSGSQLPFGINNQVGIGYTTTKVVEKDYLFKINQDSYAPDTVLIGKNMINYDALKSIKGMTIMYAFNVRTPISKHIMINYGIRYNLNLSFSSIKNALFYDNTQDKYYTRTSEIENIVARKRSSSIVSFNIGVNYVF